jgi:quercetin dioxygenase-like cupin family protein
MPTIDIPVRPEDVSSGPFKLSIYRITLEPGSVIPNSSFPYPGAAYVETGTLICPGQAPRFLVHADGSVEEVGDEDVTVNKGEAIYIPPNVVDGARNDGTDLLTIMEVDLVPMEAMATPTA